MDRPSSSAAGNFASVPDGSRSRKSAWSGPQFSKRAKTSGGTPNNTLEGDPSPATKPRNTPALSHHDYTVAWICALHLEMAAARVMLDETHETLPADPDDTNSYTMGRIRHHNVVIACLPVNHYGIVNAATVATNLRRTFSAIQIALLVGIGGGAPTAEADVRLGDVVVGIRIMQSDLGKFVEDDFQRTALPTRPPLRLSTLVSNLRAKHELDRSRLSEILLERFGRYPNYARPSLDDCIFQATYEHPFPAVGCETCEQSKRVQRSARDSDEPVVHYGAIASGSQLMRRATLRDEIARQLNVICFEMEAAGLVDNLPCLVIRGISDYSDSHKNKKWQRYAASTAAAYARELLEECRVNSSGTGTAISAHTNALNATPANTGISTTYHFLEALHFASINARENNISPTHKETRRWFLEHPDYKAWLEPDRPSQRYRFLWIRGKPGTGKSTLMKYAFSSVKKTDHVKSLTVSFFFNARGEHLERSVVGMYRSILYQLLSQKGDLPIETKDADLKRLYRDDTDQQGSSEHCHRMECPSLEVLKEILWTAVLSLQDCSLTCFIDALDESDEQQVIEMVQYFEDLAASTSEKGIDFKICFSSRHYPYIDIRQGRKMILEALPQHQQDLNKYVNSRLRISIPALSEEIRSELLEKAAGVFLWVVLVVDILNKEDRRGGMALQERLNELPSGLSSLLRDILLRDYGEMSPREHMELRFSVLWTLYAQRPLTPQEYVHVLWFGLHRNGLVGSVVPNTVATNSAESIGRYITSSSKGLAEVSGSGNPKVHFIHESVKDFLIKDKGLSTLWPELEVGSQAHEELTVTCREYLDYSLAQPAEIVVPISRFAQGTAYPFLWYATQNVLHHANLAAVYVPQTELLSEFPFSEWLWLVGAPQDNYRNKREISGPELPGERLKLPTDAHVSSRPDRHYPSTSIMYRLAQRGFSNLIRAISVSYDVTLFSRIEGGLRYPIYAALASGHIASVSALLGISDKNTWEGGDITADLKRAVSTFEESMTNLTPLCWAAREGLEGIVRILVHRGAAVDEASEEAQGETPLHEAVKFEGIIKFLIEQGADVHKRKKSTGETPLHRAASIEDSVLTARHLIEAKAEVNARSHSNSTPLHHAALRGDLPLVQLLTQNGADVNARDDDGKAHHYIKCLAV